MTDELRDHLLCIISDAIERAEDHLSWLARNPQGPDRAAQLADTPAVDRLEQTVARFGIRIVARLIAVVRWGFVREVAQPLATRRTRCSLP
jgi:hypothetical protein